MRPHAWGHILEWKNFSRVGGHYHRIKSNTRNQKNKLYMIWKLDTGKHGYLKGSRLNRITENNPVTKENNLQQRCTNSLIRNLYNSHAINTTQFSLPLKLNVGQKKTTTTNKQTKQQLD
jgi:hypothetical protein